MKFDLKVSKKGLIFKKFDFAQISIDNKPLFKLIKADKKHSFEIISKEGIEMTLESDGVVNREFNIFSNSDYTKWNYFSPSIKQLIKSKPAFILRFSNKEVYIEDRGKELIISNDSHNIGNVKLISKKWNNSLYSGFCSSNIYERETLICLAILTLKQEIYSEIYD